MDTTTFFKKNSSMYWLLKLINSDSFLIGKTAFYYKFFLTNKSAKILPSLLKKRLNSWFKLSFKTKVPTITKFHIKTIEQLSATKTPQISKKFNYFTTQTETLFNKKKIKSLLSARFDVISSDTNDLWNLYSIIFLKKEKIYTKLKYSRTPQYDIVSGGVAAVFAGFLGFLICEKFGFELLDSGDFFFVFMYVVFICFSLRLFLRTVDSNNNLWSPLSLRWLIKFFSTITVLFKNFITETTTKF